MKKLLVILLVFQVFLIACRQADPKQTRQWSLEKAQNWAKDRPWYIGANFNPSTAINQLETWQAESFDPETINRELGWAAGIGFNCMRVYLHHVAWEVDKEGFKQRMHQYLRIADKHGIETLFVFFDDCWNPTYTAGKQPDPKPGVHNSGWVRDPGDLIFEDDQLMSVLEAYVKDVLLAFRDDKRILGWDLYNEPGNNELEMKSMPLLKNVFKWAREVNPTQPLTVGVWLPELVEMNRFQLANSDIITYHNYSDEIEHQAAVDSLKKYNRPMICTEYMARTRDSRFENILPILHREGVGAINWGLVAGKSNTKYAWDDPIPDGSDPELWFHEVFHPDGRPYMQEEVDLIRELSFVSR